MGQMGHSSTLLPCRVCVSGGHQDVRRERRFLLKWLPIRLAVEGSECMAKEQVSEYPKSPFSCGVDANFRWIGRSGQVP